MTARPREDCHHSIAPASSATGRWLPTALSVLACLLLLAGCKSFEPMVVDEPGFLERAQTKQEGGVRVSVAVPSREEAKQYFGVNINGEKIQPVWLRIENGEDEEFVLLPILMDPDYFSPGEVAWKSHFFMSRKANRQMDRFFEEQHVDIVIPAGESVSGWVYTNLDEGVKYVEVSLVGDGTDRRFDFEIEVPGIELDFHRVDWDALYAKEEMRELDEAALRAELEALSCCVLGGDRKTPGDPMNIVVIAGLGQLGLPFLRRGWDPTETIRTSTAFGTALSSVFGRAYRTSPVSALYVFDRPQDFALQKTRDTVDERNHLRLWVTPLLYEGKHVYVGQISRDIGVRLSRRTLVTHKIDANVDEARFYLLQDLLLSGRIEKFGHVKGVGPARIDEPRYNYTLDPYYTDGLRAVFVISEEYVPFHDVEILDWEDPVDYEQTRSKSAGAD
jgi:hypothetical protein